MLRTCPKCMRQMDATAHCCSQPLGQWWTGHVGWGQDLASWPAESLVCTFDQERLARSKVVLVLRKVRSEAGFSVNVLKSDGMVLYGDHVGYCSRLLLDALWCLATPADHEDYRVAYLGEES